MEWISKASAPFETTSLSLVVIFLEQVLFDDKKEVFVNIHIDSMALLEYVANAKQLAHHY